MLKCVYKLNSMFLLRLLTYVGRGERGKIAFRGDEFFKEELNAYLQQLSLEKRKENSERLPQRAQHRFKSSAHSQSVLRAEDLSSWCPKSKSKNINNRVDSKPYLQGAAPGGSFKPFKMCPVALFNISYASRGTSIDPWKILQILGDSKQTSSKYF